MNQCLKQVLLTPGKSISQLIECGGYLALILPPAGTNEELGRDYHTADSGPMPSIGIFFANPSQKIGSRL
jgi:hypothetical protein